MATFSGINETAPITQSGRGSEINEQAASKFSL
jgi:hypothetical protein